MEIIKILRVYMILEAIVRDFEPYFLGHSLVSVHPKCIILGRNGMIFHVVVSVYQMIC